MGGLPEDVVVEGFAVVREAAHRVLGMRHYDVQLVSYWLAVVGSEPWAGKAWTAAAAAGACTWRTA